MLVLVDITYSVAKEKESAHRPIAVWCMFHANNGVKEKGMMFPFMKRLAMNQVYFVIDTKLSCLDVSLFKS